MKFRCECGGIQYMTYNDFQQKGYKRCVKCNIKNRSGENHYEWKKDRKAHEEEYLFRQKCYKILQNVLARTGQKKTGHTKDLLGYSHKELQNAIKSHSNWNKVSMGEWQLDHTFPIQAFLDYGIKDLKLINGLDNLRPLDRSTNASKADKYDKKEFEEWLNKKGVRYVSMV
jgi:hypothetical protein